MTFYRILSGFRTHTASRWIGLVVLAVAFLLLAGCEQTGQMAEQPRYNPLSPSTLFSDGRSARSLQPGTVSYSADVSPNDPSLTGLDQQGQPVKGFPVKVDQQLVQLGQERYNIYCIPCHGPNGEGNGRVVLQYKFPQPPNFLTGNVKTLSDGDIFQVIANGKGKMLSYGYRVKPNERWAIIAYIRALQIKNGPVAPKDITPDLVNQIGTQQ